MLENSYNMAKQITMFMCTILLIIIVSGTTNAITCSDTVSKLIPCESFLVANSPTPTPACCESAQQLQKDAGTPEARRTMCKCLVETGPSFGVKAEKAQKLPQLCNIQVPIAFGPNTDCNRIH